MKDHLSKAFGFLKKNYIPVIFVAVYAAVAIALVLVSWRELFDRLSFETKDVANYDGGLYFTVGHGIAEGVAPYSGLYENKGPMIFLLSALSYKLFGNYRLLNYLSFLCFSSMLVLPIAFTAVAVKRNGARYYSIISSLTAVAAFSILLTDFSQGNSEAVQIEAFGTAFTLAAILCCYLINGRKTSKFYSPQVILCGLFVAIATAFKEPFAIVCAVSILFFVHTKEDILYRILFPALWCVVTFAAILAISGAFGSYFTVYLSNMFSLHLNIYGSPWERTLDFGRLYSYFNSFSHFLPVTAIVFAIVCGVKELSFNYARNPVLNAVFKLICMLKPFLAFYAASFVVGLGGQYYNHHYVFAVGLFFAMLFSTVDFITKRTAGEPSLGYVFKELKSAFTEKRAADRAKEAENGSRTAYKIIARYASVSAAFAMTVALIFSISAPREYEKLFEKTIEGVQSVYADAAYVDAVLDALDKDTYLYLGFNGYTPCAYTKHLPSGPCFAQDKNNFTSTETYFAKKFVEQIESVDVIVFSYLNVGQLNDYVRNYLAENFTTARPSALDNAAIDKPKSFRYSTYFRKTAFAF